MTYIKARLPEIDELKDRYLKDPKRVVNQYSKYEILQGPTESIKFVESIIK